MHFSLLGKEGVCYVELLVGKSTLTWKINISTELITHMEGVNIGYHNQLCVVKNVLFPTDYL